MNKQVHLIASIGTLFLLTIYAICFSHLQAVEIPTPMLTGNSTVDVLLVDLVGIVFWLLAIYGYEDFSAHSLRSKINDILGFLITITVVVVNIKAL